MIDLSQAHPDYTEAKIDWDLIRDAYAGERKVKQKGIQYLPYTAGHILDGAGQVGSRGTKDYDAYRLRARFHNFLREAVQTAIGMMHSQPPLIKLPKSMEGIRSSKGETLPDFLRRINVEQLIAGRCGIMADLPIKPELGKDMPYLALYQAERIINWDEGEVDVTAPQRLGLVVLDETEQVRKMGMAWHEVTKYRVLSLGNPQEQGGGTYVQGVFVNEEKAFSMEEMKPVSRRGITLTEIPFKIINSCDLTPDVDESPLLDLATMCMTIYRADADYRHNLYMQGQDTFVVSGGGFGEDEALRIGSGARLDLPMGAKAEYVGVNGKGLGEQKEALESLMSRAGTMGAQTIDSTSRERESGDSLRIRVAARTADMNQIVEVGALGLENLLKSTATLMGENPDEVSVIPNKEFGEQMLTGQTMVEMATARTLGFPLSAKSMHNVAKKRRMTDMTFEEEMAQQKLEDEEGHPFHKPDNADRSGADQNQQGDDTSDDKRARQKAKDGLDE